MWYIHTKEYYTAVKMNALELCMLTEMNLQNGADEWKKQVAEASYHFYKA